MRGGPAREVSRRELLAGAAGSLALAGCIERRSARTIRNVVLPEAMPGILTGTILALGRAVGETAPILMVGLAAFAGVPEGLTAQGTAMPLRVFEWALHSNDLIRTHVAAAGSMTLLVALVAMNGVAILLRNKYQRDQ